MVLIVLFKLPQPFNLDAFLLGMLDNVKRQ